VNLYFFLVVSNVVIKSINDLLWKET